LKQKQKRVQRLPADDPLLEWIAWLMDESVKLGPWRVGLDGFLGLIPGFGDLTGTIISSFIIARAIDAGVPKGAILRMVFNVALDSLFGVVPLLGDLFDFAFKSNIRNLQIYKEALSGERKVAKDWGFVILVISIMLTCIAIPIMTIVYITQLIVFR